PRQPAPLCTTHWSRACRCPEAHAVLGDGRRLGPRGRVAQKGGGPSWSQSPGGSPVLSGGGSSGGVCPGGVCGGGGGCGAGCGAAAPGGCGCSSSGMIRRGGGVAGVRGPDSSVGITVPGRSSSEGAGLGTAVPARVPRRKQVQASARSSAMRMLAVSRSSMTVGSEEGRGGEDVDGRVGAVAVS